MRVLFISKPIVPPFHDGTKCLVRDISLSLQRVKPVVLSSQAAPPLGDVELIRIYGSSGGFTPALSQNLRAAAWVLLKSRADVWHFVFAPNSRTSRVGRFLRAARDVPVVQTIASPPRSFDDIDTLLFGDVVVAQSHWTRGQVIGAYEKQRLTPPRLVVIPPPVPSHLTRTAQETARVRAELGILPDAPMFVYPGDLEVSSGARVSADIAKRVAHEVPGAITVFAYRRKTARAEVIAEKLRAELDPTSTRVVGSLTDVLSLIASATALIFPVDDLWGKVDLPIVLLEAMVLGVPVLALGRGPLVDLNATSLIPTLNVDAWVSRLSKLAQDPEARRTLRDVQRKTVLDRHSTAHVARAYEELYLELGSERGVRLKERSSHRDNHLSIGK